MSYDNKSLKPKESFMVQQTCKIDLTAFTFVTIGCSGCGSEIRLSEKPRKISVCPVCLREFDPEVLYAAASLLERKKALEKVLDKLYLESILP